VRFIGSSEQTIRLSSKGLEKKCISKFERVLEKYFLNWFEFRKFETVAVFRKLSSPSLLGPCTVAVSIPTVDFQTGQLATAPNPNRVAGSSNKPAEVSCSPPTRHQPTTSTSSSARSPPPPPALHALTAPLAASPVGRRAGEANGGGARRRKARSGGGAQARARCLTASSTPSFTTSGTEKIALSARFSRSFSQSS
jgi:hypothetical protein